MTSKTRHLDTAIAILSGNGAPKRPPRRAQVEYAVFVFTTSYDITANGKPLETATGTRADAEVRVNQLAAAARALGRTVSITYYWSVRNHAAA